MKFEQSLINEEHAKEYEKAKARLLEIFQNKNRQEVDELCSEIRRFAAVIEWNPEDAIKKIEEGYDQKNPEIFVSTSFDAVKNLIDHKIEHPEDYERARREGTMQRHGNIKLSELMYYNVDLENGTAKSISHPRVI